MAWAQAKYAFRSFVLISCATHMVIDQVMWLIEDLRKWLTQITKMLISVMRYVNHIGGHHFFFQFQPSDAFKRVLIFLIFVWSSGVWLRQDPWVLLGPGDLWDVTHTSSYPEVIIDHYLSGNKCLTGKNYSYQMTSNSWHGETGIT